MVTTCPPGQRPTNVPGHSKFYWKLWFGGWTTIVISLSIAFLTLNVQFFDKFGIVFNGGPTFVLVAVVYLAISLKMVRADEVAGVFFYGKSLALLASGLHFVPFGLMQIIRASRVVQEFQCPGEPEKVFKGKDSEALPPGMVRPIRAVSRAPKEDEKEILDVQMTLDINFVVQYSITDIFDFVSNFGSKEQVEKQLRDIGEVTVVEEITRNTPAKFIDKLPETNKKLIGTIKNRFQNSGVKVLSVRLISPDISYGVSSALANIPVARAEAEQAKVRAEGEKAKRTKEREGDAAGELAWLTAQAKGRKKIMDALKINGETVIASEAVRELSDITDVIVVGAESGMKDVMGLVKGAQSALNIKKGVQP